MGCVVISYIRGDVEDSAGIKVWWIVSVSAKCYDEMMENVAVECQSGGEVQRRNC